jgi:sigma-B regulation protein RsbU (phosphoserine phosphatase)
MSARISRSNGAVIDPEYDPERLYPRYTLASPVLFAGVKIGEVRLGYSTSRIFLAIRKARRNNLLGALVVTAVTLCVGIAGAFALASVTIRPIDALVKGAGIIGDGRLDYRIRIKNRDELGLLSDAFNRMSDRLLAYSKKVEEKAKLDEQLAIARGIQQSLVPQNRIDDEYVSIDGFYRAAAGVGGDYYHYFQIDGSRYGFIMSDVSGKGVPASLMMIMIRTVFTSLRHSGIQDPARIVGLLNGAVSADLSGDRFASLLFGVYDRKTGEFRHINAGYGPLMVYKKSLKSCILINPTVGSVPIGIMPDAAYEEEPPVVLEGGDSLLLFTDGITEARNGDSGEYGIARLSELVPGCADRETGVMTRFVIDDVVRFMDGAEQYDDMALTVLKVKGKEKIP